jgi:cytochrome c553
MEKGLHRLSLGAIVIMKKKKVTWGVAVVGFCCGISGAILAAEGDREAGKAKFFTCAGCHGIEGYSNAYPTYQVPRLGGQHAEYVISALQSYASEQGRSHGSMLGNAISLTEQDMRDIASYVAAFRSLNAANPVTGDPAEGKKKAQQAGCGACHGEDGNNEPGPNPRLAGQYESYLIKALEDYQKGVRKNPIMQGIAGSLSKSEIHNLAAYYASQAKGLTIVHD